MAKCGFRTVENGVETTCTSFTESIPENSESLLLMAELTISRDFHAIHGTVDRLETTFLVTITASGELGHDFVRDVDFLVIEEELEKVVNEFAGAYLDDLIGRGTIENIARLILHRLHSPYVTSVRVSESTRAVKVHRDEVVDETFEADLFYRRGVSLLLRGELRRALNCFNQAIETHEIALFYNARGRCHRALNDAARALEDFNSAIRCDSSFGEAYRNRANVLLESGSVEASLVHFDRAIELMPLSALAWNNRGYALQAAGRFEEALQDHDKAVLLDPSYAEAFQDQGVALNHLREEARAGKAFASAKALQDKVDRIADERRKLYGCTTSHELGDS